MGWRRDGLGFWDCCFSVAQSCSTLCDPMDYSPPGFSIHGNSPGKNTGVGCHAFLQGIFPTQGLNPGLLHYRWILYCLGHQGIPRILEWISLSLLQGIFLTHESNRCLLHCRQILYQLGYQGSSTISISLLKLMFIESVMPSKYLILFCSLLLLPSIFPSIRVFSNESAFAIRWPKLLEPQLQHQSFQ